MIEIQALITEVVETFEFREPSEKVELLRALGGALMLPIVRGREEEGTLLPLSVSVAE